MAFLQHVLITSEIFSIIYNPATMGKTIHMHRVCNLSTPIQEVWFLEAACYKINTMLVANRVLSSKIFGYIYCISACGKLIFIRQLTLHLGNKLLSPCSFWLPQPPAFLALLMGATFCPASGASSPQVPLWIILLQASWLVNHQGQLIWSIDFLPKFLTHSSILISNTSALGQESKYYSDLSHLASLVSTLFIKWWFAMLP